MPVKDCQNLLANASTNAEIKEKYTREILKYKQALKKEMICEYMNNKNQLSLTVGIIMKLARTIKEKDKGRLPAITTKQVPENLSRKLWIYCCCLNQALVKHPEKDASPEEVAELIDNLKRLVSEILKAYGEEPTAVPLEDNGAQASVPTLASSSQCDLSCAEKDSQTDFENEYILKYFTTNMQLSELTKKVDSTVELLESEKTQVKKLESELSLFKELNENNEKTAKKLKVKNDVLETKIRAYKKEFSLVNKELTQALLHINKNNDVSEATSELFSQVLDASLEDLMSDLEAVEGYAQLKSDQVKYMNNLLQSNIFESIQLRNKLETKIEYLAEQLQSEMHEKSKLSATLEELTKQLKISEADIVDHRDALFKELKANDQLRRELKQLHDKAFGKVEEITDVEVEVARLEKILQCELDETSNSLSLPSKLRLLSEVTQTQIRQLRQASSVKSQLSTNLRKKICRIKILRNKVCRTTANLKGALKILKKLRAEVHELRTENENLSELVLKKANENQSLRVTNGYLTKDVESFKLKLNSMQFTLASVQLKCDEERKDKAKLDKYLMKLASKFGKLKQKRLVETLDKFVDTEEMCTKEEKTCKELKEKIEHLYTENQALRQMVAQFEEERRLELESLSERPSSSVQVDLDVERYEQYENMLKSHEEQMQRIRETYKNEKSEASKQYLNNLKLLKDTQERDLKRLKISHADHLKKMQEMHEEQLRCIREATSNQSAEDETVLLKAFHKGEIEALRSETIREIEELELKHDEEKSRLRQEMDIYQKERDKEMRILEKKTVATINRLKHTCRNYIRKAHDKHQAQLDKVKREMTEKLERKEVEILEKKLDSLSVQILEPLSIIPPPSINSDKYSIFPEILKDGDLKELKLEEWDEIIFEKLGGATKDISDKGELVQTRAFSCVQQMELLTIKESREKWGKERSESFNREKKELLARIVELEELLTKKNQELYYTMSLVESKVREERSKNAELRSILDSELKHSSDIQRRLANEFNRAEELQYENETLHKELFSSQKRIQKFKVAFETEKAKTDAMKAQLQQLLMEQKTVHQLESSLGRVKCKLEEAVECENRLTEELEREKQDRINLEKTIRTLRTTGERGGDIVEKIVHNKIDIAKGDNGDSMDLKVIFIQQCGILHTYHRKAN